ncbi:MAG: FAD-dependent oxidoreductase [Coriobacteriales bacterium]|jgi:NADPH-dependent glutamate synthase beta subunit-like oxidoreductase|nr:FAD-dependent oxidoreductase [Coriobacteriales bacterium]
MENLTLPQERIRAQLQSLYHSFGSRIEASDFNACPVEQVGVMVRAAAAESCGKCTPCRVGLAELARAIDGVLDGQRPAKCLREQAQAIYESADCAIGYEAAAFVLWALDVFHADFAHHIAKRDCLAERIELTPCVSGCPAQVDIPGYIALTAAGRYADALALVRKDNPFAISCAYICTHPCELRCRRADVDDPVNIRAIKRFAADHADAQDQTMGQQGSEPDGAKGAHFELPATGAHTREAVPKPAAELRSALAKAASTGKRIAVVGGGPSGLSAAYYLQLMGHQVTVFEAREQLGGMLRYGIPAYRLPREQLERELDDLAASGYQVRCNTRLNAAADLSAFDALYLSIGAHGESDLGIAGADLPGVVSAVKMLRAVGDGELPDLSGKQVVVIGGGNVAMDCARSCLRFGASQVSIAYRRREIDMPAEAEEVARAKEEGVRIFELMAPVSVALDESGQANGLIVKPQITSTTQGSRASIAPSEQPEVKLNCDLVVAAIGQQIESGDFADWGLSLKRGRIQTDAQGRALIEREARPVCPPAHSAVQADSPQMSSAASWQPPSASAPIAPTHDLPPIFAGGDCVRGPQTVVAAVADGKLAARAIDDFLGFDHRISCPVKIPEASFKSRKYYARSNERHRQSDDLVGDLQVSELTLLPEELCQEAGRCLRCDHYGFGAFRGGRQDEW